MTQEEEKQLLLVDLCGRLPYRVICNVIIHDFNTEEKQHFNHPNYTGNGYLFEIDILSDCVRIRPILGNLRYEEKVYFEQIANEGYISITECKPYLRPMSSMTEEERKEYNLLIAFIGSPNGAAKLVDWLNKKMFAYRTIYGKDMFESGLALKAPEGMYKEDEK